MKKRKWPYRGWHKRFFQLQAGYLTYGKSEQEVTTPIAVFLVAVDDRSFSSL